ncbi:MAG: putative C-S lyase [Clostridiales bacterium]|nr:putative C-S lyase [Clostridiales bacterium]
MVGDFAASHDRYATRVMLDYDTYQAFYNFDQVIDRNGTGSIKSDMQEMYGVRNGLLPFWIADTDFEILPEIVQALRKRCEHPVFGYSITQDGYIEAVREWFQKRYGWMIQNQWIVPSIGRVQSIIFTLQALTEEGEKILLFSPAYDPFFKIIKSNRRELIDHHLIQEGNSYRIDYDKLENALASGVRAIIFCNPHNPTGNLWSHEELKKIADLCEKYRVYVFSDEIHGDITLFNKKYTPMGVFGNIQDLLVSFTAASKTFNLAGLAASNIIIPDEGIRNRVSAVMRNYMIFGSNTLGTVATEAAYRYGESWVHEQNAYISENSKFIVDYFNVNMPDVIVSKHESTFLMWLDFKCMKLSSRQLSEIMARDYKLAMGIGSNYGEQAEGFMRFNIGCPRSVLETGADLIHKLYKDRRAVK